MIHKIPLVRLVMIIHSLDTIMENDINVKRKTPIICSMSGIYERMYPELFRIDMTDISGTNCYCDESAEEKIRERTGYVDASFVRLIDSGNYHYLSFLFMERIGEPFCLFLIDNHTDMQPPGFGRILSCGGWVRDAMEEIKNLKEIYLLGMSAEHLDEVKPLPENVHFLDHRGNFTMPHDLPIYISVDKDALSPDFAATDWDQGDMTEDELFFVLSRIMEDGRIVGVDICGEKKDSPTDEELDRNIRINSKLMEVICRYR